MNKAMRRYAEIVDNMILDGVDEVRALADTLPSLYRCRARFGPGAPIGDVIARVKAEQARQGGR